MNDGKNDGKTINKARIVSLSLSYLTYVYEYVYIYVYIHLYEFVVLNFSLSCN